MERCEERKASVIQTVRDVVTHHLYKEGGYILFVKTGGDFFPPQQG